MSAAEEIVLASHNAGKLREISELLAPLSLQAVSVAQLGLPEPEETGTTYRENAQIKALAAMRTTGKRALADDSGLSIATLDGAPGVYSADWTGPGRDYTAAFARIQRELAARGVKEDMPEAAFICMLCLAEPDGSCRFFEGRVEGRLRFPPRGPGGFGYDPIFVPKGHEVSFAEMSAEEKNALSHRGRALAQLIEFLSA